MDQVSIIKILEFILDQGSIGLLVMFVVWWLERAERVTLTDKLSKRLEDMGAALKLILDRTRRGSGPYNE